MKMMPNVLTTSVFYFTEVYVVLRKVKFGIVMQLLFYNKTYKEH